MRDRRRARAQGPQGRRPLGRVVDARCHRASRARRRGAPPRRSASALGAPPAEHHRPRPAATSRSPTRTARSCVVFNGEIYNFRELRERARSAPGTSLRTTRTDTEVIVHLYEELGRRPASHELDGMFAFALWDDAGARLLLARDRLGDEAAVRTRTTAAASRSAPRSRRCCADPDVDARARSRRRSPTTSLLGYVPAPRTMFAGIGQLPPGAPARGRRTAASRTRQYWDLAVHARRRARAGRARS